MYKRQILQGDCALNPYSYTTRELAIKRAFRILHMLGPEIDSTDDLLEFLRTVPVAKLLSAAEHAYSRDVGINIGHSFVVGHIPFCSWHVCYVNNSHRVCDTMCSTCLLYTSRCV